MSDWICDSCGKSKPAHTFIPHDGEYGEVFCSKECYSNYKRRKQQKPRIYLSHSAELREAVKEKVIPELEKYFIVVNPFDARAEEFEGMSVKDMIKKQNEEFTHRWVVSHDYKDIDTCVGGLVINTQGATYGSAFEMAYMTKEKQMPVAVVIDDNPRNKEHMWLRYHCICVTREVAFAIDSLAKWFNLNTGQ